MRKTIIAAFMVFLLVMGASAGFGAPLEADRRTPARSGQLISLPVAVANTIYQGALVARDANGRAVPGSTATGLLGVGRAGALADNSLGINNAISVTVEVGVYRYKNSGSTDLITRADIGKECYIVDDQTVAKTSGAGTRSVAGRIQDVDFSGVWVDFRGGFSAGVQPQYVAVFANTTDAENDNDGEVIATHAIIEATDNVTASMVNSSSGAFINATTVTDGQVTFRLSGNGGAGTRIFFQVHRTRWEQ